MQNCLIHKEQNLLKNKKGFYLICFKKYQHMLLDSQTTKIIFYLSNTYPACHRLWAASQTSHTVTREPYWTQLQFFMNTLKQ